ncbi:hypothetical protein GCM10014719_42490 [Planomonospora parontospora subsp. antibiotica]|nr:hypothetical protein GCM10014719_42490 [Planomonospora parontospora subsp. antibiotica]GII17316.1 hypothetical protein Ppa05_40420 [Planomonospora parontospora subsp. antibiotica]
MCRTAEIPPFRPTVLRVLGGARPPVRSGSPRLSDEPHRRDGAAAPIPAGIGFTVSLLIAGPAFGDDPERSNTVTADVPATDRTAAPPTAALPESRVRAHPNAQDDVGIGAR